jgi:4-amino-4-deoxy-L-arabinose transferase-like glycosyltransferase
VIALLSVFGIWATRLDTPYTGRHDNNTAWVHIAANNYLRQGYLDLRLGQAMNVDPASDAEPFFYQHHPPLISILASFFVALLGDHEASVRLMPMFMTLIAAAAVCTLARWTFGPRVGWISALLFVATPMIAYYGQMANHEPVTLAFLLLAGLFYLRYLRAETPYHMLAAAVFLVLAIWAGWPALFFAAGLAVHAFLLAPRRWWVIGVLSAAVVIALAAFVGASVAQNPDFFRDMEEAFVHRVGSEDTQYSYNLIDYLRHLIWVLMRIRYTMALLVLAALGLIVALVTLRGTHARFQVQGAGVIAVLAFTAAMHIAVFRQGALVHDYWSYYFAPVFAILGAVGASYLFQQAAYAPAVQRWAAGAVLLALLAVFAFNGFRYFWQLYQFRYDLSTSIAPAVQATIPPGEPLWIDHHWRPAVWYYAERDFGG